MFMEQLILLFSGWRWQDMLDIVFNTYILFRLYVLFRGTNVLRVLMAVVVMWIIGRSANAMGLVITNWVMQGVITVATFIIIIVFRNEISGVVRTRSLSFFLWEIPRTQINTPVSIISDAVAELAGSKIGALIVMPLKTGVDSIIGSGTDINASLSKEMLVNIFWPGAPLHDGAAVIQRGKITRAGTILPLSQNRQLASKYGTRHRAALGLTEQSDALVIVVSEERGKVSLVKDNRIHEVRDPDKIETLIKQYTGGPEPVKKMRRQTRELLVAAMVCLLCTTGLWLSFSRGMETLANYDVPIEFMNSDKKMNITYTSASRARLLISGARPLINALTLDQMSIKISLDGTAVGKNKLTITRQNVQLPPGIRLKNIEPDQVELTLDTMVEKRVPVQADFSGKLPEGLIMSNLRVMPETVKITGGELTMERLTTVFTEKIHLENLTTSGVINVGLVMNPATLRPDEKHKKVQIRYTISKKNSNDHTKS
ncbi:DisA protein [Desulfobacter hydrogenophilus]|uniref:Diadenylate cyclase n=3 Tax=Desulfobacter hydrogenophilus TaxID=2291 RepID=A0A328FF55_9BACT|nr:DisA protein [Desulfobacter hydrogenophilus]QBH12702.1 DisA protein [Desulfobacter hydrogenophilus]RAM03331.1 DisA protein [Desulfobacter hydrogenophilus]